jgi:hypothetical protein
VNLDLKVDTGLVIAKLRNADADMRDLTAIHKSVAKIVLDEWQRRVPVGKVNGGRFKAGGRAHGTQKKAFVDAAKSGPVYAGVAEFGGRIPRYHSRKTTLHKPTARSLGMDSYYLYPARDEKMPRVVEEYEDKTQALLHKHGF